MPRSIPFSTSAPGVARYQLGGREEFAVLAVTFLADVIAGGPQNDDDIFLDYRDPSGGIIYRQYVAQNHQPPSFYSLSPDAEPFVVSPSAPTWPQLDPELGGESFTMRLTPVTLAPGCTVNIYAYDGSFQSPATDPMDSLDPTYVFKAHLWVEDTSRVDFGPPHGPYMLVPGPAA